MRAALAALLIASTAVADSPAVEHAGGCWLPAERCISTAQELARLRAENEELRKPSPAPVAVIVTLVVLALGAGYAAGRAGR